ncbi:hypothetical protein LNQ03_06365 [Klebsiella pneumoniae subsp. pneumoniae]|nr:hypothetical protein [Klebsiella pneumoniae subsp. pneumoniae]
MQTTAPAGSNTETLLADDRLGGLSDIWLRLQRNMSPESALFRHAVRMSLVLCAGYMPLSSLPGSSMLLDPC